MDDAHIDGVIAAYERQFDGPARRWRRLRRRVQYLATGLVLLGAQCYGLGAAVHHMAPRR